MLFLPSDQWKEKHRFTMSNKEISSQHSTNQEFIGSDQPHDMELDPLQTIERLVSQMKTLGEENQELARQMRDKEEFVSMVCHELKNPLTPILGFSDLLKKKMKFGYQLSQTDMQAIFAISQSAIELKQLVDDLLSVYKLDLQLEFTYSDTDIITLADEVISDLVPVLSERAIVVERGFSLVSGSSDSNVICDQLRIKQVIVNLIRNAADFVPKVNGIIRIGIENPSEDLIAIRTDGVNRLFPSDLVLFSVDDNGCGVPTEKIPSLFKKFYQADRTVTRRYGGTGLGLTICKGIIETHGGKIWYERSDLGGASFKFLMPRAKATVHAKSSATS